MKKNQQTVTLPKKALHELLEKLANIQDELEDYLMFQDQELLRRLRRAKKDHEEGRVVSLEEVKRKYDL